MWECKTETTIIRCTRYAFPDNVIKNRNIWIRVKDISFINGHDNGCDIYIKNRTDPLKVIQTDLSVLKAMGFEIT